MNPTGKKFVSLLLVFALLMLSVNLYAKKRGANIKIWKKDGRLINGELIAVKENSLLVLDTEGKDVNIEINEITLIGIKRKLRALKGFVRGTLIYASYAILSRNYFSLDNLIWNSVFLGGSIGALIGVITRASTRTIKTIHIEGMTDSEIKEALDKLRKRSRVRDYK
ncbi:MAG: hypothetical protein E3J56_15945 [Candidatus Aminicenantes bacterium]|nr:MAG: hypothetical protein E3J56_15945 [Candidatus Aminicenantes bacterium]